MNMREINGHKRNFRKSFFNFIRKYSKIMLQLSYIVHVNPIQITVSKDLQPEIKIDLCTSHKCKAMKTLALFTHTTTILYSE